MNLKSPRIQKILIALGVLILATAAYFFLMKPNDDVTVVVEESTPASEAQAVFLNLAAQLEPVAIDTSILSDPRFLKLQDIHTAVVPEAAGRNDPFAPLGGAKAQ